MYNYVAPKFSSRGSRPAPRKCHYAHRQPTPDPSFNRRESGKGDVDGHRFRFDVHGHRFFALPFIAGGVVLADPVGYPRILVIV